MYFLHDQSTRCHLGWIDRSEWAVIGITPRRIHQSSPCSPDRVVSPRPTQTHLCQGRYTASTLIVQALSGRGPNNEVQMPSPRTHYETRSRKHTPAYPNPTNDHDKHDTFTYEYPPHVERSHISNGTRNPQPHNAQGKVSLERIPAHRQYANTDFEIPSLTMHKAKSV